MDKLANHNRGAIKNLNVSIFCVCDFVSLHIALVFITADLI